jgi:hypothetical protein
MKTAEVAELPSAHFDQADAGENRYQWQQTKCRSTEWPIAFALRTDLKIPTQKQRDRARKTTAARGDSLPRLYQDRSRWEELNWSRRSMRESACSWQKSAAVHNERSVVLRFCEV